MGKLVFFITVLVMLDLFFVATGQLCGTGDCSSISSIIFTNLFDLDNFVFTNFFTQLIGDVGSLFTSGSGLASLAITAGVTLGAVFYKDINFFFIPVALGMALLLKDFVNIFSYLNNLNPVLAVFIFAPILIIYSLTILEWMKNKD